MPTTVYGRGLGPWSSVNVGASVEVTSEGMLWYRERLSI